MIEIPARRRDERTSVDKAASVLKAFGKDANIGVGVSELARRAGLSKSTTFRLLGMLEGNGFVERAGTAYRLGRALLQLGAQTSAQEHELVRDVLTPFIADLYEATRMTVQLGVLDGTNVIYLNKLEGHQRLRSPSRIGGRMPAYCTGVGKILLAYDHLALEATLRLPRYAWTASTLVEENQLRDELDVVRRSGIALDRGESLESLVCIAAAVIGPSGRPVAALSVSGDVGSFRPEQHENVLRRVCYAASRAIANVKLAA
jgi:IclR family KDG regulon transcriptional repressor